QRISRGELRERTGRAGGPISASDLKCKRVLQSTRAEVVSNRRAVEHAIRAPHHGVQFARRAPRKAEARTEVVQVRIDQTSGSAVLSRKQLLPGGKIKAGDSIEQIVWLAE